VGKSAINATAADSRSSSGLQRSFRAFWKPEQRQSAEEQISALVRNYEHMNLGWFWATDADGGLTYLSSAVCRFLGAELEDLVGRPITKIIKSKPADPNSGRSLPLALTRQNRFDKLAIIVSSEAGERYWTVSGTPQYDSGRFVGFLGHGSDVTDATNLIEESSKLAMYDSLTGLPNRRHMQRLVDDVLRSAEAHQSATAVMLVDLDRFKQINDTLGHPAGDDLLKQVATRLTRIVGQIDNVGRIGGDEFQVIFEHAESAQAMQALAERIIEAVSEPYSVFGSRCVIGASVGIAMGPFPGQSGAEVVRNADLALYAAKSAGRGRWCFFEPDLLEAAEDRRQVEQDLMDALQREELEVNYQPIVDATTGEAGGFEALLRWNHPQRGRISPALFIPIAEETNLICRLGEWVLRQACSDAAAWPHNLRVAVNVSPIQFADPDLPKIVSSALANSGLAASRLELEITESIFLGRCEDTDRMFDALKNLGVRLALDDFGTGYSSLGYLKTAPFDKIKIDQSFVRDAVTPKSRNKAIIAAIVTLANSMGMDTTAEGVETFDQLALIKSLGVGHVQGYLYSMPLTASEITDRLIEGSWTIAPSGHARQRHDRRSTYKKVEVVHADYHYTVTMRNLSRSGALIEGLCSVPIGTQFVLDLCEGQLVVATVKRSWKQHQGIEFEQPLVDDGNGGLRTPYRVSPVMLFRAGLTPGEMRPSSLNQSSRLATPAFAAIERQ
jgi:diguanylate cyclase (GGDEF)-like protein/PAS domain S-box-containing protein